MDDGAKTRIGIDALATSELECELRETLRQIAELRISGDTYYPNIQKIVNELGSFAIEADIKDEVTEDNFWNIRGQVRAYYLKKLMEETNRKRKLIKEVSKTDLFGGFNEDEADN